MGEVVGEDVEVVVFFENGILKDLLYNLVVLNDCLYKFDEILFGFI